MKTAVLIFLLTTAAWAQTASYDEMRELFRAADSAEISDFPSSAVYHGLCVDRWHRESSALLALYRSRNGRLDNLYFRAFDTGSHYPDKEMWKGARDQARGGWLRHAYFNSRLESLVSWEIMNPREAGWYALRKGQLRSGKRYFVYKTYCYYDEGCNVKGFHLPKGEPTEICYFSRKISEVGSPAPSPPKPPSPTTPPPAPAPTPVKPPPSLTPPPTPVAPPPVRITPRPVPPTPSPGSPPRAPIVEPPGTRPPLPRP